MENMETGTANKTLNYTEVKNTIVEWLKNYATNAKQNGYVIGISGGIDSAVCSTLCAMTGLHLTVVRMSIHQALDQADRGAKHIEWLKKNFSNVKSLDIELTETFDKQMEILGNADAFLGISDEKVFLAGANTRARLRAVTLYAIASTHNLLVCGTGNKVEDYGVQFFTKYGDGAVDISPIGDLMKTETYILGKELGVIQEILDAIPSDGLWGDNRSDESQIGASYPELEWAMNYIEDGSMMSSRQKEVLDIYRARHTANAHKMSMPPICDIQKLRI